MASAPARIVPQATEGRSRIAIGTLALRIASDRPPEQVRLPGRDLLAEALAEVAAALDPADTSFWVVRRLTLARNAASTGPAGIAEALAQALREALAKVLRGEICDGVMRFADRTDWLAALLWAHVMGEARRHWAFARHAALDALPPALVPRQLFAAEPAMALPVLGRLAEQGRLAALAAAIGESGARALIEALEQAGDTTRDDTLARAIAEMLVATARTSPLAASSARATLIALGALAARGSLTRPPSATLWTLARQQAARQLRDDAGQTLPASARRPGAANDTSDEEASQDRQEPAPHAREQPPLEAPAFETPHAGVLLLWRSVRELGLEAILPEAAAPGHAALTLAAMLAGPARDAAWRDPALHWLTGFEPGARDRPLKPDPGLDGRLAALLAERAAPVPLDSVRQRAGGLAITQDRASEDWLAIHPERGGPLAIEPLRPLAGDIAFFRIARSMQARPWALLARAAYGDCARRLTGLERSSAAWLWRSVLAGWGRIEPGEPAQLMLPRVPLDLVLRMTGLDGTRFALDDGRAIEIRLPGRE